MQGKFIVTWKPKLVEDKNKLDKSKIKQKAQGRESDIRLDSGEEAKTTVIRVRAAGPSNSAAAPLPPIHEHVNQAGGGYHPNTGRVRLMCRGGPPHHGGWRGSQDPQQVCTVKPKTEQPSC